MRNGVKSQRQLGKAVGCSERAIRNALAHAGLPKRFRDRPTPATPWGKAKCDAFQAWRAATLSHDPAAEVRSNGRAKRGANPLSDEMVRLRRLRADLLELEVRVRRGELVNRAEMDSANIRHILLAKRHLLDAGRRVAGRLSGRVLTELEVETAFREEINASLAILSGRKPC